MKLVATDDDNRRLGTNVTLGMMGQENYDRMKGIVERGDTDELLEALEEIYEQTDDVTEAGLIRDFADTVEAMGVPVVEIEGE